MRERVRRTGHLGRGQFDDDAQQADERRDAHDGHHRAGAFGLRRGGATKPAVIGMQHHPAHQQEVEPHRDVPAQERPGDHAVRARKEQGRGESDEHGGRQPWTVAKV